MMPEHTVFSRHSLRPLRPSVARLVMLTGLLAFAAACGGTDDAAALDADLTRDLSMASEASSTVPIAFGDTAAGSPVATPVPAPELPPVAERTPEPAPAPARRPTPRPAPVEVATTPDPVPVEPTPRAAPTPDPTPTPAPVPSRRTMLLAGAELLGTTGTRVCSSTNRPGDRLVMRLTSDVTGPDGARLVAGTPVLLELASASDSGLVFRVKGISVDGEIEPVVATASVESDLEGSRISGGNDKKKVIGGAIAGAIIGGILGKDTKGAVIGAAGGAAAGTVAARRSGSTEQCLAAGSNVRVVLEQSLVITRSGA